MGEDDYDTAWPSQITEHQKHSTLSLHGLRVTSIFNSHDCLTTALISKEVPMYDFDILDQDFENAATYFSSTAFGNSKEDTLKELKRLYDEDENLHSLVYMFAKVRVQASIIPEGHVVVPLNPPEVMWDGITRRIIQWMTESRDKTPRDLLKFIKMSVGRVPDWLANSPDMQNMDHVLSVGTRAVLIYQAMLNNWTNRKDHPVEPSLKGRVEVSLEEFPLLKHAYETDPNLRKTAKDRVSLVPQRAEEAINVLVGEGLSRDSAKHFVVSLMKESHLDREVCTCLSELEDDAYELGGPMSRHKRPPPCVLHKGDV
jgi:hypothetical protein